MQCPFCKVNNDRVIDSRETDAGMTIRRRRVCQECGKRFTTYERPETAVRMMVIKKDDSRVPYERNKILAGVQKACYKRPVAQEELERLVDKVEEDLFARFDREIPSRYIGQHVAEALRKIDEVAYVRFASVYREFRDVGEFIEEAQSVLQRHGQDQPGQRKLFDDKSREQEQDSSA